MINKIKKWNIWWMTKEIPLNLKKITRTHKKEELMKLINPREILVLSGVRRSGKSTLMYQIMDQLIFQNINPNNIFYFNFDEPLEKQTSQEIEKLFNSYLELKNPQGRIYVFFDEIQNMESWHQWVKSKYDLLGKKIKFIISGSNNSLLNQQLGTLLTGRIFLEYVYPLSFREFLDFVNYEIQDQDLEKEKINHYLRIYIQKGGFPETVLEEDSYINNRRLQDYFDSILFRDVLIIDKIREASKLRDLAYYALTNISNLLSYSKIEKAIGLNINTVKDYLFHLENAYLLFQINFFSFSVKESITIQKPRKIYAIDQGLRKSVAYQFSEDTGRIVENIVFLELKRRNKEIYFWNNQNEIDFVIKNKDNTLTLINVCYGSEIHPRELRGFEQFNRKYSRVRKKLIITHSIENNDSEYEYIPLSKFLLHESLF